jgi:hypothetical protein
MFTLTLVTYKDNIRNEEFIREEENLSVIEDYVDKHNFNNQEQLHNYTYHIHSQKYNDINKKADNHYWLTYQEGDII